MTNFKTIGICDPLKLRTRTSLSFKLWQLHSLGDQVFFLKQHTFYCFIAHGGVNIRHIVEHIVGTVTGSSWDQFWTHHMEYIYPGFMQIYLSGFYVIRHIYESIDSNTSLSAYCNYHTNICTMGTRNALNKQKQLFAKKKCNWLEIMCRRLESSGDAMSYQF